MAVFVAGVGILIERARQLIETIRLKLFTGRSPLTADYDAPRSEIAAFLLSCRRIFWGLAAFSGLSNILMLTGSFFMLQVYDRVLPGRSVPTLVALMTLATMLYVFQGDSIWSETGSVFASVVISTRRWGSGCSTL